jgi:hypothetical protein
MSVYEHGLSCKIIYLFDQTVELKLPWRNWICSVTVNFLFDESLGEWPHLFKLKNFLNKVFFLGLHQKLFIFSYSYGKIVYLHEWLKKLFLHKCDCIINIKLIFKIINNIWSKHWKIINHDVTSGAFVVCIQYITSLSKDCVCMVTVFGREERNTYCYFGHNCTKLRYDF